MTNNKKSLSLINAAIILSLGMVSANSYAETKFTPKFEIGYGGYELELTNTSKFIDANNVEQTTITTQTAVASFVTYAVGGSLSFDSFMIDLTYKGSAAGEQDYLDGDDLCGYNFDDSCGVNFTNDGDFEHSEIAATIGYQIGSFAIFGGYQAGETILNHNFTLTAEEDNWWGFDPGQDVTEYFWGNDIGTNQLDITNETAGFFVGAGYGFAVGSSSSINLSAGYSLFDVELEEKWQDQDWTQSSSGEGSGISVAAIYNYHFTNSRLYVKFDFQAYTQENFTNYEYDDGDDPADYSPDDADENYYRFSVGYAF